ncbi:response regulator transcription factor [Aquabacterium sp. A7-Y]|uniref:response regulator n=1 Tax=Aquabacterium sp. A7-Y TaxID=1349605 RepID=UPI00223D7976|nr:response regulator transcription factor [Aquabacterium sp. A7-Y]MCW7538858.1 response regulator transcription factor [Aquabacterium sp. A7-Y]
MWQLSVAVVEDDAKFRQAFVHAIEAAPDLKLAGAGADGASGLALLKAARPDVLLVDLGLPDIGGIELIRYCAAHLPECDVMVVTVFGDEQHVVSSLEAGATGYLLKDTLPEDIAEQIRALHAGGSPISPVIARQLLNRLAPASSAATVPAEGAPVLSERELAVLTLATKGFTYEEIAQMMSVSKHTVMTYVKRSYRKLQVNSKSEAVYEARKLGLLRD